MTRAGKKVTWNGVEYPTLIAAAAANNLTVRQLWLRLDYGFEKDSEVYCSPLEPEKLPTTWEGVEYESVAAAARATGINYKTLYKYRQSKMTSQAEVDAYHKKLEAAKKREKLLWRLKKLQESQASIERQISEVLEEIENA